MNAKVKSILAVIAGLVVSAILSAVTDLIFGSTGIIKLNAFKEAPTSLILLVILYRFIFNSYGSYITAKLAPSKPMKHAMILGIIGLVLSILGTIIMWDKALPWYNVAIIVMAIPSAYIGGKLYLRSNPQASINELK
ncbi:MAG TPA: hypothetical protein VGD22_18310 [Sphingobacteriaceae bacterium]